MSDGLRKSTEKMRAAGMGDAAVQSFAQHYEQLQAGERGMLAESELDAVDDLPDADDLPPAPGSASEVLDQTVVLKLNGGLGTSMGMTGPKSLVEVKDGQTFLDITARQVLELRRRTGARLPLVLMNSFATREASLAALDRHPGLAADVPADFVQSRVPKLRAEDLMPVEHPLDPALEWAPPGHGDLYASLVGSGMLAALLGSGYAYAFVANVDNLGAVLDPRILTWFAGEGAPLLMEVADRTPADRKGGHIARRRDGRLVLREVAQTPEEDLGAFQDVARHRFFNTNTLWIDLRALRSVLDERDGVLGLPMIVNRKTVDPGDASSTAVVQLETAMGAAIDVFEGARAVRVSRRRFAPVKTTDDLLALRSDAYVLTGEARVELADQRRGRAPLVDLDPAHYRLLRDFDARFADGAPSLVACDRLSVAGDVTFGPGVVVRGDVSVAQGTDGPRHVPAGTVLEG